MDIVNKKIRNRVTVASAISTTVICGNVFLSTWSWAHSPLWVSIITTIVATTSIFAWVVAIALFTE